MALTGSMMGATLVAVGAATPETTKRLLLRTYTLAHERALKVVDDLTEEQLAKPVHPAVHSIGWQLWHTARWEDRFAEILLARLPELATKHGPARQLWNSESIGERWGLPVATMGYRDTGTSMEDAAAEQMRLPAKAEVVDYARRAFAYVDEVCGSLTDEMLLSELPGDPDHDSVGQNLMLYLEHVNRHLGMMEAMKGQLGLIGSVTR
jgi:uncharacterized damage-inducible protein DinB